VGLFKKKDDLAQTKYISNAEWLAARTKTEIYRLGHVENAIIIYKELDELRSRLERLEGGNA
jgi:hypothetical protein